MRVYPVCAPRRYERGGIATVYPIARGSGVALTAVLSGPLLGQRVEGIGALGVALVVVGVVLIGVGSVADAVARWFGRRGGVGEAAPLVPDGSGAAAVVLVDPPADGEAADTSSPSAASTTAACCGAWVSVFSGRTVAVLLAVLTGVLTAAYQLVDKRGVSSLGPVAYSAAMNFAQIACLTPPMLVWKLAELRDVARTKKGYAAVVGVGCIGLYLIVLFALQLADVEYVVARSGRCRSWWAP